MVFYLTLIISQARVRPRGESTKFSKKESDKKVMGFLAGIALGRNGVFVRRRPGNFANAIGKIGVFA